MLRDDPTYLALLPIALPEPPMVSPDALATSRPIVAARRRFAERHDPPPRPADPPITYPRVVPVHRIPPPTPVYTLRSKPAADDVAALVAHADRIAVAEPIAREVIACLQPWARPQPTHIAWRVVDRASWTPPAEDFMWEVTTAMFMVSNFPEPNRMWNKHDVFTLGEHVHSPLAVAIARHLAAERAWPMLVAAGHRVPQDRDPFRKILDTWPASVVDRPFAELTNPFTALLRLWTLGCAPEALTPEAMVLAVARPR